MFRALRKTDLAVLAGCRATYYYNLFIDKIYPSIIIVFTIAKFIFLSTVFNSSVFHCYVFCFFFVKRF